ncbi:hypothetical protein STAS_14052 [Striga asiatica]|uniref:Uncharacterized protein n=1 Tax=Striga asiatica TaxID=4170 RepID=A0A5A7PYL5_STRAF|nr:hypothetical protein STAS_14052 [Striga asiatica]
MQCQRSLNVNEEYLCAIRTKSFAHCFTKFQLLVNEPSPPTGNFHSDFSEVLLQPSREAIASILDSSALFSKSTTSSSSSSNGLKSLLLDYFETSAESSDFCTRLLETLAHLQSDCRSTAGIIDSAAAGDLLSRAYLQNPFPNLNRQYVEHLRGRHSSVLRRLRSGRSRAAWRLKLARLLKRVSIVGSAVHGFRGGPPGRFDFRFIGRAAGHLDAAAKGAYILSRDFETMSRLAGRVGDEVEHGKAMIRLCLDRREDKVCLRALKEMRKDEFGLRRRVEELEEHRVWSSNNNAHMYNT